MDNQQGSPVAASQPRHPHGNLARQVATEGPKFFSRILRRADEDRICSKNETCGRGISPNATNLAIALGVVIPVVAAAITFFFLHRRSVKRMHMEDAKYRETNLDYGLDEAPSKGKRMTSMFGAGGEKQQHRPGQLSMDMNLSSPYLLPPDLNQSKDSIHSLAKSYNNRQDPYHTVPLYSGGDGSSIRSFPGDPYSPRSSKRQSFASNLPPRSHSKSQSPLATDPFATPTQPEPAHMAQLEAPPSIPDNNFPVQPIVPEIGTVHDAHADDQSIYEMPDVASPPAALAKDPKTGLPIDNSFRFELPGTVDHEARIGVAQLSDDIGHQNPHHNQGLGLNVGMPTVLSPSEDMYSHPIDSSHVVYDEHNDAYPQIHTTEYYEDTDYVADDLHQGHMGDGLGVPQTAAKRLSVGVVPLPPAEVTQSEDPEYRANRIRSFYKEYFEDYADAPPLPGQPERQDDYNAGYLGDAAYYDADSNAFVMPYAQPVTRRAMTPPPGGARRGPPGPGRPRGPGSVGGMSLPGGRGRPRAGSHGHFSQPKRKLPPPAALNTLPTPSKLKDDNALLNAMDFAPPELFKDQVAGRSQSPLGERRPYKPGHAGTTPIVTAFDELAALPSPHLLRKSSTFTGLDFAPPKRFKDDGNASDAGSIKSNRSGISAVQLGAIRNGAGRVSRLPGDTVFTTGNFGDQLKPQWGMRQ
ncbi:hypothetical protein CCM_08936 [Cordyceps militaris CM01]|uniref:Uncharacterized protein n=1 Tax=Cordyceps militaris (strain CM01) TaxID=983644 RepID=G3JSP4_CORMM|nr:uncharacterized protein CCM_08936 [Cordyceps militaris CM01]EGX88890.1 hypothetical protein CCM_08936 [Cordyceps militaris CM01]